MERTKTLKIKIPLQDMESFNFDSLIVDPFWYDVYGIKRMEIEEEEDEFIEES